MVLCGTSSKREIHLIKIEGGSLSILAVLAAFLFLLNCVALSYLPFEINDENSNKNLLNNSIRFF